MVISDPATGTPQPYPIDQASATEQPPTPTPDHLRYDGPALNRGNLGVQIHLHREDLNLILSHLGTLGIGWVKVQVSWKI